MKMSLLRPNSLDRTSYAISAIWVLSLILTGAVYLGGSPAIAGDHMPPQVGFKPELIFKNNCSVCHGDHGDGRSRASTSLVPPPRNFTTASDLTREKMIATVTHGKPGTAMMAWKTQLNEKQIEAVVDYVRSNFMQEAIERHLSSGGLVYGHNCASCHGNKGQGVKPSWFKAAPRSFSSPQAATELNRERMIAAVTKGVPDTAMTGYADKLSTYQIESVVDYIREALMVVTSAPVSTSEIIPQTPATVAASKTPTVDMSLPLPNGMVGDPRLGEQFFMGNCATCHGKLGNGQGQRAYFMTSKPRNFQDDLSRATLNRPVIFSAVTQGRPGTEMPAWGKVLSKQEIANVTEFVFQTFIQPGIK